MKFFCALTILAVFVVLSHSTSKGQAPEWDWVVQASGTMDDQATAIAADTSTNTLVVVGNFVSPPAQYPGIAGSNGLVDGFVAKYDTSGNVLWSFNIGGLGNDSILSVSVDPMGDIYISGYFDSPLCNFPGTSGPAFNLIKNLGGADMFVAKFDPNGVPLWAVKNLGGIGNDKAASVFADTSGVYVTGTFRGSFSFGPWIAASSGFFSKAFILHLDPSGGYVWAVEASSGNIAQGWGVYASPAGVFATGFIEASSTLEFYDQSGNLQPAMTLSNGNRDGIFIVGLDLAGVFQWTALIESSADCRPGAVLERGGSLYVTGGVDDDAIFPGLPGTWSQDNGLNIFLSSHDLLTGNTQWLVIGEATEDSWGTGIAIGSAGELAISGYLEEDLDMTPFGGPVYSASFDAVALGYDTSGSFLWAKTAGSNAFDIANGIAFLPDADAYFLAGMYGNAATFDALTLPNGPGTDIWVGRLEPCSAEFTYAVNSFCNTDTLLATILGSPNGTFSNPGGDIAILDASTGEIDLANSTLGGPFPLIYTTPTGCMDTLQINVMETPLVDLGPDSTLCAGDSLLLDAGNPGFAYLWSTGDSSQTITANAAGVYSVTVDNNGCIASDSVDLDFAPYPQVDLGPDTSICTGLNLVLDAGNAGAAFLWSTGATSQSISVSAADTYAVTVTNAASCASTDSIVLGNLAYPLVDLGPDSTLCAGDSLLLDAGNPGLAYLWSTGDSSQTITANAAGVYSVTVDNNGCTASDSVDLDFLPFPVLDLGADTSICPGQSLLLDASFPGASYLWSTGATTASITTATPGSYAVTVSNGPCESLDSIEVTNPIPISLDLGADTSLCVGESLFLDAGNPGNSYNWSTGATSQSITVTGGGSYSVAVDNGCGPVRDTILVLNLPIPALDLGPDTNLCNGGSLLLDASGPGYSYSWSNGALTPSITVSAAAAWAVTVTDANGCSNSDSIRVSFDGAVASITGLPAEFCEDDGPVLLNGLPSGGIFTGPAVAGGVFSPGNAPQASPFWISYIYTDSSGCIGTDSIQVTVYSIPVVDAGQNEEVYFSNSYILSGTAPANAAISWSLLSGSGEISDPNQIQTTVEGLAIGPNSFQMAVNSAGGCFVSDQITLNVIPFQPERAFSPNGDNINDFFVLPGLEDHPNSDISIFNRWGQLVFEAEDYQNNWDGSNQEMVPQPPDTYFYVLVLENGTLIKGNLALQR